MRLRLAAVVLLVPAGIFLWLGTAAGFPRANQPPPRKAVAFCRIATSMEFGQTVARDVTGI